MRRWTPPLLGCLLLVGGLAACTPEPVQPTEGCTEPGSPPPGAPGSAEVLLTVASAPGTRQLTTVLYADGWLVALADDAAGAGQAALLPPTMAPPPPAGRPWQPAYIGSCELQGITDLAAEELTADADLGDPQITDQATTFVTYYGADTPTTTRAYALGSEDVRLSRSDRHGRAVLTGLIDALREATPAGEVLPVQTVQVFGDPDAAEPAGWPGPPLAELLVVDGYCGEVAGGQARRVLEFLADTDEEVYPLRAEAMPPGLPSCG